MRAKGYFFGAAVAAILIFAAACAGNNTTVETPGELVGPFDQLMTALGSEGFTVDPAGTISQPFFEPEGQVISLDGQEVQVFEFASEAEAASAAEMISPDGSSIGTSMMTWISPPHFYHSGKLMVLYLGENERVMAALEGILGPQIAGR